MTDMTPMWMDDGMLSRNEMRTLMDSDTSEGQYTNTPSKPVNMPRMWKCDYCSGTNADTVDAVVSVKCSRCGAPRPMEGMAP